MMQHLAGNCPMPTLIDKSMEDLGEVPGRGTSKPEALAALCLNQQVPCFLIAQGSWSSLCVPRIADHLTLSFTLSFIFLWVQDFKTQNLFQHIYISSTQNTRNHLGHFQQEGVKYRESAPYKNHQRRRVVFLLIQTGSQCSNRKFRNIET